MRRMIRKCRRLWIKLLVVVLMIITIEQFQHRTSWMSVSRIKLFPPFRQTKINIVDGRTKSKNYDRDYTIVPKDARPLMVDKKDLLPAVTDQIRFEILHQADQQLEEERVAAFGLSPAASNWQPDDKTISTTPSLQILLVTYYRSGSTFVGDLLNHYPGVFYHFEPLQVITGVQQVTEDEEITRALELLINLLDCDYRNTSRYYQWIYKYRAPLERNYRLLRACSPHPNLCLDITFLRNVCRLHPIQLVKTVRLRLQHATNLLKDLPNLKIIYLVRDPRGIFHSRKSMKWCREAVSCIEPKWFCQDILNDIEVAHRLQRTHANRFLAVRYEDMALNPEMTTNILMNFLNLKWNAMTEWFLETHTRPKTTDDFRNPYSTIRNSSERATAWTKSLSNNEIAQLETYCTTVIDELGFD